MDDNEFLRLKIEPSMPIELNTFAASLYAYGDNFNMFAKKNGGGSALLLKEVSKGSIVVDLVCSAIPLLLDYVAHFKMLYGFFCKGRQEGVSDEELPRAAKHMRGMVAPIVSDPDGLISIFHIKGGVTIESLTINYQEANACDNSARRRLETRDASEDVRLKRMLTIERFAKGSQNTCNAGVVEDISPRAMPLIFNNDADKGTMLHDDPFNKAFIVDLSVMSARGQIRAYKILKVHESIPLN